MVEVYTIQISEAHRLGLTSRCDYLDTTIKSGDSTFAPTWDMVMAHKKSELTDDEYRTRYLEMMRASYKLNRNRWDDVLNMEQVILACYCRENQFCHRFLLATMLGKCGATLRGEWQDAL